MVRKCIYHDVHADTVFGHLLQTGSFFEAMDQLSLCTPTGLASADVGGNVFNLWLEEEEEQWHIGQKLLSSCPAEFLCPISLDVMTEPVVLVGA